MSVDVDRILGLLDSTQINRTVLQQHDVARETLTLPTMIVRDHQEFKYLITAYVEHHLRTVGEGVPTPAAAFGEAKRILDRSFNEDQYQDGYTRALQMGLDGNHGGMRAVLNAIADTLKQRALGDYLDHVYHQHINVLSKDDTAHSPAPFTSASAPSSSASDTRWMTIRSRGIRGPRLTTTGKCWSTSAVLRRNFS
jgi:hypothetical protein